jgi:thiol-disulfide isomerase/thioredoxin
MRVLFSALLIAGLAISAQAQDPKPAKDEPKKPETTLKVGDTAPTLKVTKWLQGTEVKSFTKDQVYVVEFWATWCGPCIVMMPHMGELQAEYKGKATFIGFSAKDANNPEEKVAAMVAKRGPKLGYTFVYADDKGTYDAYMKAAGRNGIPCCFVVGKDGKIAYIGHPMYLDVVLPKVVAGKWTAADATQIEKIEADVNAVFMSFRSPDPEAALKALADFEAKHPPLAHIPYFVSPKLSMMVKAKKYAEAKKFAEEVLAKAAKQEDPMAARMVAGALAAPEVKEQKDLAALANQANELVKKLTAEK